MILIFAGPAWPGEVDEVHAVYIGVIDIEKSEQRFSMKVKVFTDDLEDALRNANNKTFSMSDEKVCIAQKVYLEKYFTNHLKIKINKTELVYQFTRCEKFEDAVWLSFEGSGPVSWKEFSITADFLIELFPTQTNVVNLSVNGKKRFLRLTNKQPTGQLTFD